MSNRKCATCKANNAATDAFKSQFARLETRMDNIEQTLNKILDRLPAPGGGDGQTKKRKFGAEVSETDQDSGWTFGMAHFTDCQPEYTPLDTTQSQIRLLKLHKAERFIDPLIANLDIFNLDDGFNNSTSLFGSSPSYIALSYTWGTRVFEGVIMIDGRWVAITKSLENALRQLRDSRQGGFETKISCWVDQLCINQSDIDERSNQVNLMRRIYKKAQSVLVWLGEEANDSSLAIDILNTMGAPPRHAPGERPIQYPSYSEEDIMRHWSALRALFKRPWWQRVWIRQEIALHRTVELWCGNKTFDMMTLEPALSMLSHIASFGYTSSVSYSDDEVTVVLPWDFHARKLIQLRELTSDGSKWVALGQLLRITRACEATDNRDMVFSVLGMADPEVYSLAPDYRQELKVILLSATQAALGQQYGLELLGACQNPERKDGMPSWIPLLTEKWRAIPFPSPNTSRSIFFGQPSQFLTQTQVPSMKVNGEILALEGGLVDYVVSICNHFVRNNSHAGDIDSVYDAWKSFAEHASMKMLLSDKDSKIYVESNGQEKTASWIRFLTIRTDPTPATSAFAFNRNTVPTSGGLFGSPTSLNPKLARSYLLPSSYTSVEPRLDHELHAGFQSYGIGRRLGVTRRGYLALLPAESRKGDRIALFQGATFPYVLRKLDEQSSHILVGESFIPSWITQPFGEKSIETISREDWNVNLNEAIQIC